MKALDLTGRRYGRLYVVSFAGSEERPTYTVRTWHCLCECGNTSVVTTLGLRSGDTTSCGCYKAEMIKRGARLRHGMTGTSLHVIWGQMIARCHRPTAKNYADYGGRGIHVCDRWKLFENFAADMGPRPPGLTLERIDNSKGYEPNNCRWATYTEQMRNQRMKKSNKTGVTGVWRRPDGRYQAAIRVNKQNIYLGTFSELGKAAEARAQAMDRYGFPPTHGAFR